MKLKKIEVRGFRGLRQFDIEFELGKPFLMFGLNGTGKSSLFQAIHFAVTGELTPVSAFTTVATDVYRHKGLGANENASVKVLFEHGGQEHTVQRRIDSKGLVVTTSSSQVAEDVCRSEYNGLCFLTRPKFAAMIEAAERDRWTRFAPLLGHGKLSEFRSGMRTLHLNITRDLEITRLTNDKESARRELDEASARLVKANAVAGLGDSSSVTLRKALIELGYKNPGDPIQWDELQRESPGADQLRMLSEKMQRFESERIAIDQISVDGDRLQGALLFMRELHERPDSAHELIHASFYQATRRAIADLTTEPCPLCGLLPADWEQVRASVTDRVESLKTLSFRKEQALSSLKAILQLVDGGAVRLKRLVDTDNPSEGLLNVADAICSLRDLLSLVGMRLEKAPVEGASEQEFQATLAAASGYAIAKDKYGVFLAAENAGAQTEFDRLSASPAVLGFIALRAASEANQLLTTAFTKVRELETKLKASQRAVELVQAFAATAEREESELAADLLSDLEGEVQRIFAVLTSSTALMPLVPTIRVETDHGIRYAHIEVRDFYGLGAVAVRDYLSEANRNALGLAIYFAGILRRGPALETIILDDISHSADDQHRRGMAAFIVNKLADHRQVLIFTHDTAWYARITDLFEQRYQGLRIMAWAPDGTLAESDRPGTLLQRARVAIRAGDPSGGNLLRQAMERFLDEMCEAFAVDVPFKRSVEMLKFEVKRQRFTQLLQHVYATGNGIVNPAHPAVRVFTSSQRMANLASHQPTAAALSQQDLLDALGDFIEFIELFTCDNPRGQARCGAMLSKARKENGLLPQCGRCSKVFLPLRV